MKHLTITTLALAAALAAVTAPQTAGAAAHPARLCPESHTSTPLTPLPCTSPPGILMARAAQTATAAAPSSSCIKPYTSTPVACVLPTRQNQLDANVPVTTKTTKAPAGSAPSATPARRTNKTHSTKHTQNHRALDPACYIPYTHLGTACILPAS